MIAAVIGVLAGLVGAALLYLGAPHQRVLVRKGSDRRLLLAGTMAEAISLAAFLMVAGPATAVFIWLTLAMLVWSTAPLLTVGRAARRPHR